MSQDNTAPGAAMAAESGRRAEATLAQLTETLRWDDAPAPLRSVLPLARLLRRLGGLRRRSAPVAPAGSRLVPEAQPPQPRRSLAKRMLIRGYILTRPVALPIARRLHGVLSVLLERESFAAQRVQTANRFTGNVEAELLRSIEAAMLTLALQPRDGRG